MPEPSRALALSLSPLSKLFFVAAPLVYVQLPIIARAFLGLMVKREPRIWYSIVLAHCVLQHALRPFCATGSSSLSLTI